MGASADRSRAASLERDPCLEGYGFRCRFPAPGNAAATAAGPASAGSSCAPPQAAPAARKTGGKQTACQAKRKASRTGRRRTGRRSSRFTGAARSVWSRPQGPRLPRGAASGPEGARAPSQAREASLVPEATMLEAIRQALFEEMQRDATVVTLGEDIGVYGGAFKATEGLLEKFGPERVIDTPISETAIVGAACGMSYLGLRP